MSGTKSLTGVSQRTFIVGLIVAILASSALSTGVAMTVIQQGPQGPKGDKGDTGAAGAPGEDGADASGGIALPVVALVIAIIAAGMAVMGMRRRV